MEIKCSSSLLFILAFFLLVINANAAAATTKTEWLNDRDQCKDVIQDSPEFGVCLKAISLKWPIELAMFPSCFQFKKMDENCRCEAVKRIVNAALAAAGKGSPAGQGDHAELAGFARNRKMM